MRPRAFIKKWENEFLNAILPIMEAVKEGGYKVSGPYSLESEGPIFGFLAWKPPVRPDDNEAVDVWWRFDPIYDEKPVRYWPALDLIERGGSEVGSENFWDESVDLNDDRMIRGILEGLEADTEFILEKLGKQNWHPEHGPKEWSPRKS